MLSIEEVITVKFWTWISPEPLAGTSEIKYQTRCTFDLVQHGKLLKQIKIPISFGLLLPLKLSSKIHNICHFSDTYGSILWRYLFMLLFQNKDRLTLMCLRLCCLHFFLPLLRGNEIHQKSVLPFVLTLHQAINEDTASNSLCNSERKVTKHSKIGCFDHLLTCNDRAILSEKVVLTFLDQNFIFWPGKLPRNCICVQVGNGEEDALLWQHPSLKP